MFVCSGGFAAFGGGAVWVAVVGAPGVESVGEPGSDVIDALGTVVGPLGAVWPVIDGLDHVTRGPPGQEEGPQDGSDMLGADAP